LENSLRRKLVWLGSIITLVVVAGLLSTQTSSQASPERKAPIDQTLRTAIEQSLSANPDQVVATANQAANLEPKSRLAHWLAAQSVLTLSGDVPKIRKKDQDLLAEAGARLYSPPAGHLPAALLHLQDHPLLGRYSLLVDLSVSRIYIFRANAQTGLPELVDQFYTTLGISGADKKKEGDRRTPIGVYRLVKEIQNPRADGFLGKLAITLDYPNPEDKREGRTGSGIWIHGVPDDVHVRPPKASDGCLAISNDDMIRIKQYVDYGKSYILISKKIQWLAADQWRTQNRRVTQAVAGLRPQQGGTLRPAGSREASPILLAVFDPGPERSVVTLTGQPQSVTRHFIERQQLAPERLAQGQPSR
jgi:hypothetical protein